MFLQLDGYFFDLSNFDIWSNKIHILKFWEIRAENFRMMDIGIKA